MITAAAVTEFTSKLCAPISTPLGRRYPCDGSQARAQLLTKPGGATWFFVTVDFSFGASAPGRSHQGRSRRAAAACSAASKFPLGNTDFSSQILQAQTSGAKVLGLASVGGDQVNLVKQLAEFGLQGKTGQTLAGFLVYITDIDALGLDVAQGLRFPSSFYWDQSDATRAFSKRFFAERRAMPTQNQANIYAATRHFLQSMAQAGTRDPVAVNGAMRARPLDYFAQPATIRADGRVLHDVTLWRVKSPAESHAPWDYLAPIGTIPATTAFLPATPACVTA